MHNPWCCEGKEALRCGRVMTRKKEKMGDLILSKDVPFCWGVNVFYSMCFCYRNMRYFAILLFFPCACGHGCLGVVFSHRSMDCGKIS